MAETLEEKRARIQKKLEERQAKSAPSSDDTSSPLMVEEPISKVESGLRGAAQGATLGLADELTGAGEAGLDAAKDVVSGSGAPSFEDLVQAYKKHRDESRSNYKAAEQANPMTYAAGQITGGIAPIALSGGAGAGIQGAGRLGAIAGLGTSDTDLTNPDISAADKVKDVGTDMLTGAGLGYLTASVPAGISALKNKTLPGKLFSSELAGKRVLGEEASRAIEKQLGEAGSDVATGIQNKMSEAAKTKSGILDKFQKEGKNYSLEDIQNALAEGKKGLRSPFLSEQEAAIKSLDQPFEKAAEYAKSNAASSISENSPITDILDKASGKLTPEQMDSLRASLGELGYVKDLKAKGVPELAKRLSGQFGEKLNYDVNPKTGELVKNELGSVNDKIRNLIKAQEVLNVGGEGATEYGGKQVLTPLTARLEKEGTSGMAARQKFQEGIDALKRADPEFGAQAEDKLKQLAEQYGLNVESGTNFNVSHTGLLRQAARVPGYIGRGLHATDEAFGGLPGMLAKPAGAVSNQVIKESGTLPTLMNSSDIDSAKDKTKQKFSEMSPEQLLNIASRLKGKGIDGVAKKVEQAAQSKDPVQKAQAEFVIKQNPSAKRQIENPNEEE